MSKLHVLSSCCLMVAICGCGLCGRKQYRIFDTPFRKWPTYTIRLQKCQRLTACRSQIQDTRLVMCNWDSFPLASLHVWMTQTAGMRRC